MKDQSRFPVDLTTYDKIFDGKHFAIGLRASEDRHITFSVLYKDDDGYGHPAWWPVDNHYISTVHGASSAYLEDLVEVTAKALAWCKSECDPYEVPLLSGETMVHGWRLRLQ